MPALNMPTLKKGDGWGFVMVPALVVKLSCGHTAEIPPSWVMASGRLSCCVTCPTCKRRVYDLSLEEWEVLNG